MKVDKNPAFDPLVKGRKIGDYLDAATRMYALINQSGRNETSGPTPHARAWSNAAGGAEPENLGGDMPADIR